MKKIIFTKNIHLFSSMFLFFKDFIFYLKEGEGCLGGSVR